MNHPLPDVLKPSSTEGALKTPYDAIAKKQGLSEAFTTALLYTQTRHADILKKLAKQ